MSMVKRVYNPTPYQVMGSFNGSTYEFAPGTSRTLSDEAAWWILERFSIYGLVDIDAPDKKTGKSKTKYTSFIVRQALTGLENCLNNLHNAVESFFKLDTELKQQNQHGTVLRCKEVKELTAKIETITHLIADIEKKHGISIAKQDYTERCDTVMKSIDSTIEAFEADEEAKTKSAEEDAALNSVIRDIQKGIAPGTPA